MSKQVKKPPFYEVVCQDIQIVMASLNSTNARTKGEMALALLDTLSRSYVPAQEIPSITEELRRIPELLRENGLGSIAYPFQARLEKLERDLPLPRAIRNYAQTH